jgi:hypothetical protein
MRSFNFPIELGRSRFNIDVPYPFVLDMPVKLSLKLMASVCSDRMDTEGKLFNHIINELDSILLIMTRINFHGPDPGCIINSRILKASDSYPSKFLRVTNLTSTWT